MMVGTYWRIQFLLSTDGRAKFLLLTDGKPPPPITPSLIAVTSREGLLEYILFLGVSLIAHWQTFDWSHRPFLELL